MALAPGRLVKQWTENNRNYYSYQVDGKMLNFYSFLSADYQVKRENYRGVELEVYYYKGHGLPSRLRPISARPTFTVKV